jgi:hypothetical protein
MAIGFAVQLFSRPQSRRECCQSRKPQLKLWHAGRAMFAVGLSFKQFTKWFRNKSF